MLGMCSFFARQFNNYIYLSPALKIRSFLIVFRLYLCWFRLLVDVMKVLLIRTIYLIFSSTVVGVIRCFCSN